MFGVTHGGVTEYINAMTNINDKGEHRIDGWSRDLATLKRLRHIRNQIAHDSDDAVMATSHDVADAEAFYKRIMKGLDPLAMVRSGQHQGSKNDRSQRQGSKKDRLQRLQTGKPEKRGASMIYSAITAIVLLVLLGLVCYYFIRIYLGG